MAVPTSMWSSYGVGWGTGNAVAGNREMSMDIITIISPTDAATQAAIGRTTTNSLYHDYSTDALEATATAGSVEGIDWSGVTAIARKRIQNYVQRFRKDISVSDDQIQMSRNGRTIGVDDEMRYQLGKGTKEVTRNGAARLWSLASAAGTGLANGNDSGATGDATAAGEMRNFHWFARSGGGGAFSAVTANQGGAFSTAKFYALQAAMWANGAQPDTIFCSMPVKVQISRTLLADSAPGSATLGTINSGLQTVVNNDVIQGGTYAPVIDVVRTDYGRVAIVPDRWMPTASTTGTTAMIDDAAYYLAERAKMRCAWWKPVQPYTLPPSGPAAKAYVLGAFTVEVLHPQCLGMAYGVTS